MRVMIGDKQVATIEEGELFGTESFFGVSGADFRVEARDWAEAKAASKAESGSFLRKKHKVTRCCYCLIRQD